MQIFEQVILLVIKVKIVYSNPIKSDLHFWPRLYLGILFKS